MSRHTLRTCCRPARRTRRGASWVGLVVALFLVVAGLSAGGWLLLSQADEAAGGAAPIISKVSRGQFLHEVTERGEVESASNVEVRCQVKSPAGTPVVWIIPEGTIVTKGDKLVELNSAALKETETQQKIVYEQARAAMIQADLAHKTAGEAIEEYKSGTYIQEVETVDGEIFLAEENLRRSQDYADYSEKLYAKGYVTAVQLDADKFAVKNAELALKAAKTKKRVLQEFTFPKTLASLEAAEQTAIAQKLAQQAAFKLEQEKLAFIRDQIAKCTIHAPEDGLVVYANKTDSRGNAEFIIEEGTAIREQQVIIRLPDIRKMQVRVRVNESKVDLVKLNRTARVRVDAIQGMPMEGLVTRVDSLPLPSSWSRGNVKDYLVLVSIDQPDGRLKPGMTADVTILVEEQPDVLQVPVQAVVQQSGKFFVYQYSPEGPPEQKQVQIGSTNDQFVVIKAGLEADEGVVLDPRSYLKKLDPTSSGPSARFVTSGPARKGKGKRPPAGDAGGQGERAATEGPGGNSAVAKGGAPVAKQAKPGDLTAAFEAAEQDHGPAADKGAAAKRSANAEAAPAKAEAGRAPAGAGEVAEREAPPTKGRRKPVGAE